jgi:thiol-disulfide isomerase/thioredoxin
MRPYLVISFVLLTVLAGRADDKPAIRFASYGWEEALKEAGQQGKQIFLYAYTPSCRYCKQMEREVFTNKEVADFYNTTFINYKVNIDDGAAGEALAKKYGIKGFPSYVFFDKNGQRVHQSGAGKQAGDFINDGRNALNPETALFTLQSRYDQGDRSKALLFNYSHALDNYLTDDSPKEKVVAEYLATQSPSELNSEANLRFIYSRYLDFKATATQYFLANQAKFVPLFPAGEVERRAQWIITSRANTAGRQKDLAMLREVKDIIAANGQDTSKYFALAQIYYYNGQQDWPNYAKATARYGKTVGSGDWQTLYETGAYLKAFAKDQETLTIGVQIMEQVIKMNKNYENLCIYASLQNKAGHGAAAIQTAKEAVKLAKDTGGDSSDAENLLAELKSVTGKK